MKNESNRRKFLNYTVSGAGAVAGALALGSAATAPAKKEKPTKKVITRPGQPITSTSIVSPGIQFGNLLFVSGAGAHDPETHKVVPGPISNQVRQCLENLKTVIETAGSSMDKVLKCNVFLVDIADFKAMNEVYHTFFPTNPPARSTVAVKELPGNSPVEIECIAYVD